MIPDRLDNLTDRRRNPAGCFEVHVVPTVQDDLLAVRGEPSELGLAFFPFLIQLCGRHVEIVVISHLRLASSR